MSEVNQAVKAIIVAELRNPAYEGRQIKGYLRRGDKFCVWGVICNAHAKNYPEFAAKQTEKERYGDNAYGPCHEVRRWISPRGHLPTLNYNGQIRGLAGLNDTTGLSFKQIADLIEQQW